MSTSQVVRCFVVSSKVAGASPTGDPQPEVVGVVEAMGRASGVRQPLMYRFAAKVIDRRSHRTDVQHDRTHYCFGWRDLIEVLVLKADERLPMRMLQGLKQRVDKWEDRRGDRWLMRLSHPITFLKRPSRSSASNCMTPVAAPLVS